MGGAERRRLVSDKNGAVREGDGSLPASHVFLQGSRKAFHLDHNLFKGEAVSKDMAWKSEVVLQVQSYGVEQITVEPAEVEPRLSRATKSFQKPPREALVTTKHESCLI